MAKLNLSSLSKEQYGELAKLLILCGCTVHIAKVKKNPNNASSPYIYVLEYEGGDGL